jgi:hypothetical protein
MAMTFDATLKVMGRDSPRGFLAAFDQPTAAPVKLLNVDLSTVTTSADLILGLGDPLGKSNGTAFWRVLRSCRIFADQPNPAAQDGRTRETGEAKDPSRNAFAVWVCSAGFNPLKHGLKPALQTSLGRSLRSACLLPKPERKRGEKR